MKRLSDILFSSLALLCLLPVILLISVVVKLSSKGPIFYRQVRVGKGRKEFRLIKFRTMEVGSDKRGLLVTTREDDRVTAIGRLLRRTKLDELPELWNVLIGEMSLVGPRPEVPKYVEYYKPEWERVFSVRPGITDLATLQFYDEESVLSETKEVEKTYIEAIIPVKMNLALQYIDRNSIGLYFKILFLTLWRISLGRFFTKPNIVLFDKGQN